MIPVYLDYRDGEYSMDRTDEGRRKGWQTTLYIPLSVWEAYERHRQECRTWYHVLSKLGSLAFEDKEQP